MTPSVAVVIPSNRPECLAKWYNAWRAHFEEHNAKLYVVWDDEQTRKEIDDALGPRSWVIPWRTDCVRSWGYLKAHWDGADVIVTLDDDCLPPPAMGNWFLDSHLGNLTSESGWVSTIEADRFYPRGYPKDSRAQRTAINHGLWENVPDVDGETQLTLGSVYNYAAVEKDIPPGKFFPMSGMNLAWKREVTPLMWFGLQGAEPNGDRWGYDRFGDIWCGLFAKRVCDHLQYTIHSGYPVVWHDRASDPHRNAELEAPGKRVNEWLWRAVSHVPLSAESPAAAYRELSYRINLPDTRYWWSFRNGMRIWADLVERGI